MRYLSVSLSSTCQGLGSSCLITSNLQNNQEALSNVLSLHDRAAEDELMTVADEKDKLAPQLEEAKWRNRQLEKDMQQLQDTGHAAEQVCACCLPAFAVLQLWQPKQSWQFSLSAWILTYKKQSAANKDNPPVSKQMLLRDVMHLPKRLGSCCQLKELAQYLHQHSETSYLMLCNIQICTCISA